MKLNDQGLIINRKKFNDHDLLLHVFSYQQGVLHSLVKKPHIKKQSSIYQIGNLINFTWQGRLNSQLGTLRAEIKKNYASILTQTPSMLYIMTSMCGLLSVIFPPRQQQEDIYNTSVSLLSYLQSVDDYMCLQYYFWWEMKLLQTAGYGLSYQYCAVTGTNIDLCYMSPKTGAVVTRQIGRHYASQLLSVPEFLYQRKIQPDLQNLQQAFRLVTYFLYKHFPEVKNNISRHILLHDILPSQQTS